MDLKVLPRDDHQVVEVEVESAERGEPFAGKIDGWSGLHPWAMVHAAEVHRVCFDEFVESVRRRLRRGGLREAARWLGQQQQQQQQLPKDTDRQTVLIWDRPDATTTVFISCTGTEGK